MNPATLPLFTPSEAYRAAWQARASATAQAEAATIELRRVTSKDADEPDVIKARENWQAARKAQDQAERVANWFITGYCRKGRTK